MKHQHEQAAHSSARDALAECRRERDLQNLIIEDFRSLVVVMEDESADTQRQEMKRTHDVLERRSGAVMESVATQTGGLALIETSCQTVEATHSEAGCQMEVSAAF